MTASRERFRVGRPYRRLRRWARHTPNGEIAVTLVGIGVALVFIAVILAVVAI
jgi:hypothetical protein